MLVSIITSSYNSEKTIIDTIKSVNNQTYSNIEHIFIDGNSHDSTLEIIKKHSTRKKVVVSEKDEGIYFAMNKGLKIASGNIIAILNSDDFYANKNVVENIVSIFKAENSDAVYADLDYIDKTNTDENTNEGNIEYRIIRKWRSGVYKQGMLKFGWMPPHPTLFVTKKTYNNLGLFNTNFKSAADYEIMLRFIHKNSIKLDYLPKVTVKMRIGGLSNSSIKQRLFANKEDRLAWRVNKLKPFFFTLYLKPLRKVLQYL